MDLRQPVTGYPHTDGPDTGLTAFAFVVDPQLGTIDTPNGKVTFHQAVGASVGEKARMQETGTRQVLAELALADPLLITDPARAAARRPDPRPSPTASRPTTGVRRPRSGSTRLP